MRLSEELSNAEFDEIYQAFLDHHVIFFRGQAGLTPEVQRRFARRFGAQVLNAWSALPCWLRLALTIILTAALIYWFVSGLSE